MTSPFSKDYVPPERTPRQEYMSMVSSSYGNSLPGHQFKKQTFREYTRLSYQLEKRSHGRRQTLPWDDSLSLRANAFNNVRDRWVEQGIWADAWGPAWTDDGPELLHSDISPLGLEPFPLPRPENRSFRSGEFCWGHEMGMPTSPKEVLWPEEICGSLPHILYGIVKADIPNPEASRPQPQFLYQVEKEREWLEDEMRFAQSTSVGNLKRKAQANVRRDWIQDGIWRPEWRREMPGLAWYHDSVNYHYLVEPPALAPPLPALPMGPQNDMWLEAGYTFPGHETYYS